MRPPRIARQQLVRQPMRLFGRGMPELLPWFLWPHHFTQFPSDTPLLCQSSTFEKLIHYQKEAERSTVSPLCRKQKKTHFNENLIAKHELFCQFSRKVQYKI